MCSYVDLMINTAEMCFFPADSSGERKKEPAGTVGRAPHPVWAVYGPSVVCARHRTGWRVDDQTGGRADAWIRTVRRIGAVKKFKKKNEVDVWAVCEPWAVWPKPSTGCAGDWDGAGIHSARKVNAAEKHGRIQRSSLKIYRGLCVWLGIEHWWFESIKRGEG